MNKRTTRLLERNTKINKRFKELSDKKKGEHKLYTTKAILSMIGDEFYLSDKTIENIVMNYVEYKK